jgi:predicted dehydrogenase
VSTDTHVTGVLVHESGALSTLVMSFDAVATKASNIEIHGETGSLIVPDPNRFEGDVQLRSLGSDDWETLPVSAGYVDASRGIGIQDLALTEPGAEPRASAQLAFHSLEVMESVLRSAHSGQSITISSTCARPEAVPLTELSVHA